MIEIKRLQTPTAVYLDDDGCIVMEWEECALTILQTGTTVFTHLPYQEPDSCGYVDRAIIGGMSEHLAVPGIDDA